MFFGLKRLGILVLTVLVGLIVVPFLIFKELNHLEDLQHAQKVEITNLALQVNPKIEKKTKLLSLMRYIFDI